MFDQMLPSAVFVAEIFGDDPEVRLFSEEQVFIRNAVPKRKAEFSTVRGCARRAMKAFGHSPVPILPGEHGAPSWPYGLVGSMTHCAGYRAAAVANSAEIIAIGIDAEPNRPLPVGVLEAVALSDELHHLRTLPKWPQMNWDRLLFSAKESVYKTLFPKTHWRLGFDDATITFDPHDGTFRARLLTSHLNAVDWWRSELSGHWFARDGLLCTAIAVPAGGRY